MNFKEVLQLLYANMGEVRKWSLYDGDSLVWSGLCIWEINEDFSDYHNYRMISLDIKKVVMTGEITEDYFSISKSKNLYLQIGKERIPIHIDNISLDMPVIDMVSIVTSSSFQGELSMSVSVFEGDFDDFNSPFNKTIVKIDEFIESRFDILDL